MTKPDATAALFAAYLEALPAGQREAALASLFQELSTRLSLAEWGWLTARIAALGFNAHLKARGDT